MLEAILEILKRCAGDPFLTILVGIGLTFFILLAGVLYEAFHKVLDHFLKLRHTLKIQRLQHQHSMEIEAQRLKVAEKSMEAVELLMVDKVLAADFNERLRVALLAKSGEASSLVRVASDLGKEEKADSTEKKEEKTDGVKSKGRRRARS